MIYALSAKDYPYVLRELLLSTGTSGYIIESILYSNCSLHTITIECIFIRTIDLAIAEQADDLWRILVILTGPAATWTPGWPGQVPHLVPLDAHVGLLTTLYITCKDFIGYLTLPVPLTIPVLLRLRGSLGIFTIFCGWLVWAPVGFLCALGRAGGRSSSQRRKYEYIMWQSTAQLGTSDVTRLLGSTRPRATLRAVALRFSLFCVNSVGRKSSTSTI